MEKNVAGDTPLHIAVRNGYLYQVPSQFLTSETLSVYDAVGETSLHMAANNGQFCRIPRTVLTSELLGLPTRNQVANTVLHLLAQARRLNQIPPHYITSESWNCPNGDGLTLRDIYERACELINSKNQSEPWRTKPLTDKQANKLTFFGCTWDQGITRGQASEAIDECARAFPDLEELYYSRPATEEQLALLKAYLEPDDYAEEGKALTYRQAKDLICDCEVQQREEEEQKELPECSPPTEAQIKTLRDSGFKVDRDSNLSAADLDALLKLEGLPPRQQDLDLFGQYGLNFLKGDAFAAYALGVLIRQFEEMAADNNGYVNIVNACTAAMGDPVYLSPTVSLDELGAVLFAWPKKSLRQWFQQGLE